MSNYDLIGALTVHLDDRSIDDVYYLIRIFALYVIATTLDGGHFVWESPQSKRQALQEAEKIRMQKLKKLTTTIMEISLHIGKISKRQ